VLCVFVQSASCVSSCDLSFVKCFDAVFIGGLFSFGVVSWLVVVCCRSSTQSRQLPSSQLLNRKPYKTDEQRVHQNKRHSALLVV
jgi:hypothetical protein